MTGDSVLVKGFCGNRGDITPSSEMTKFYGGLDTSYADWVHCSMSVRPEAPRSGGKTREPLTLSTLVSPNAKRCAAFSAAVIKDVASG